MPGSKSLTNFSIWSFAETLIPRQKLHSLDKVLNRGQILEMKYLGRDDRKISRGLSLEIAYNGRNDQKISRSGRRTSQCMLKNSRGSQKLVEVVEKFISAWLKKVWKVLKHKFLAAAVWKYQNLVAIA